MMNPIRGVRLLNGEQAEALETFTDDVHSALDRKVKIYVTWTPDIRFGWKRHSHGFVGCYVRWNESTSPGGESPTVFFCSDGVKDFGKAEELDDLDPSY